MTDQKPSESTSFSIGVGLDVGIRRAGRANQDNIGNYADVSPDEKLLQNKGLLYILADGMGGAAAGDTASEMAVRITLTEYYKDEDLNVTHSLQRAIQSANRQIHVRGMSDLAYRGMGTTLVGIVLHGKMLHVVNVGDSRAYLLRRGKLEQLTTDHSLVQAELSAGLLTPEEAAVDKRRNILLRNLGYSPKAEPDLTYERARVGDVLLLCSDGLWGEVSDEEIREILQTFDPPDAAQKLVDLANKHGGSDNISLIVLRVNKLSESAQATQAMTTQPLKFQLKKEEPSTSPKEEKNKSLPPEVKPESKNSSSESISPFRWQWLLLIVLLFFILLAIFYWYLMSACCSSAIPTPSPPTSLRAMSIFDYGDFI